MWDDSSERRELIGYTLRSSNRKTILRFFSEHGSAIPSEIADHTNIDLPHISRGLSELEDRGLVELLVPEDQRKNRLYDITSKGLEVINWADTWVGVKGVHIVSEDEFSLPDLLEFLQKSLSHSLLGIFHHNGDEMEILFTNSKVEDRFSHDETLDTFVNDLQSLSHTASQEFANVDRINYGFFELEHPSYIDQDSVWVLTLHPEDSAVVSIASDSPPEMLITSFAKRCLAKMNYRN